MIVGAWPCACIRTARSRIWIWAPPMGFARVTTKAILKILNLPGSRWLGRRARCEKYTAAPSACRPFPYPRCWNPLYMMPRRFEYIGAMKRHTDVTPIRYLSPWRVASSLASCVTEAVEGDPAAVGTHGTPRGQRSGALRQGQLNRRGDLWCLGWDHHLPGLFTAGPRAGTFRVIASARGAADTATVTLTAPAVATSARRRRPPPDRPPVRAPTGTGVPMGMAGLFTAGADRGPFAMSLDGYNADNIVARLETARAKKLRVLLNMTGGNHNNYKTDGVFDITKWMAKMQTYNTTSIQAAIAAGVADGTIIGNSVMDEPHNDLRRGELGAAGYHDQGPGGRDVPLRQRRMFPTLPVGVVHDHRVFEPETGLLLLRFHREPVHLSEDQGRRAGASGDGGLAFAARNHMAIIFSINILDGGIPRKATGTCEIPETGRTRDLRPQLPHDARTDPGFRAGPRPGGLCLHHVAVRPGILRQFRKQGLLRRGGRFPVESPRQVVSESIE